MENYEQKYKEALERARNLHDNHPLGQPQIWSTCEKIFPELKESEDDKNQRIKNEVIEMLHYYHSKSPCFIPPQFSLEETLAWLERQAEQKPSWNEEDSKNLNSVKWIIENSENLNRIFETITSPEYIKKYFIDWLKSLKGRVQPKQEWSEEDEDVINHLLALCAGAKRYRQFAGCLQDDITKYQTWLKSLKDRVQPQQKQEWSEEDEKILKRIDNLLYSQCTIHGSEYEKIHNWLKSIKPQNR